MILFKRFLFIISLLQEMSPVQVRYAGAERERIGKDCSFMLLRKPKATILRQNDWPTIMGTFQKQKKKKSCFSILISHAFDCPLLFFSFVYSLSIVSSGVSTVQIPDKLYVRCLNKQTTKTDVHEVWLECPFTSFDFCTLICSAWLHLM